MPRARLRGRVVLITGGSRGLGLVLARRLARKGARIAICARDENELERAREDLAKHGADAFTVTCTEQIAGRLDTGFIARFNERRAEREHPARNEREARTGQDIAIIAAALAFRRAQTKSSEIETRQADSKWRMTGRASSMNKLARDRSNRF